MKAIKIIKEKFRCRIAAVICRCVNHDLVVTKMVSPDIQELKCLRCGEEFGICHSARAFLPLTR